ncbi:hypothetical protein N9I02_01140, partial [Pontimonas sp.]
KIIDFVLTKRVPNHHVVTEPQPFLRADTAGKNSANWRDFLPWEAKGGSYQRSIFVTTRM